MAVTFSPAPGALSLLEFIGTTGVTVTALYETETSEGGSTSTGSVVINSVSYADTVVSMPDDLIINFTEGSSSFTISSKFEDMFYRVLKYLLYDADNVDLDPNYNIKTYLEAYRFRDLPELYTGVWEFIPSPVQTRLVPFSVNYTATVTTTTPADPETGLGGGSSTSTESGTVQWTFTIEEDWTEVIRRFLLAVNNGSRVIYAKTKYPELSI